MSIAQSLQAMAGLRPLDGVRVLAVENFVAGPYCSMWLADAGAEVIKVENPATGGDLARATSPVRHTPDGRPRGLSLLRTNRNKKSLTLDLKHPEGRAVFAELAQQADIVVENLRAGVMDRLGVGYAALAEANPRLIYVALSGFGQAAFLPSPMMDQPAFDIVGQALAGLMNRPERQGDKPAYLGFSLADIEAGMLGAYGATLALIQRGRTGRGQLVDISLYDACLAMNEISVALYSGQRSRAAPGLHAVTAPFGSYRAADGWIVIAVLGEPIWKRFCAAIAMPGLLDDPRFATGVSRSANNDALTAAFAPWLAARSRAEALAVLLDAGVPCSAVHDVEDLFDCPHVAARQMLLTLDDPAWGPVQVVGNPVKMSDVPPVEARLPPDPGQDTDAVLMGWLGLSADRIAALRAGGAI